MIQADSVTIFGCLDRFPTLIISRPSVIPCNCFGNQELIHPFRRIKPAPAAILNTTHWERRFIMYRHTIYMHGSGYDNGLRQY